MASLPRRTLLAGLAGAGVLAASGCSRDGLEWYEGELSGGHWPGQSPRWRAVAAPPPEDYPNQLVVVLHGRGANRDAAFDQLGLQDHARANGLVIASVDGGDLYWHARRSGADTGAMVRDELLRVLHRELGTPSRFGLLGWSMGGFGALLLASDLGPERVGAVVAESAALWTEPGDSAPGAFDDREDFEAHDVFDPERLRVLEKIPVRLDCGRSDSFAEANRAFARALPSATLTVDDGGHTGDYWRAHAAVQLRWMAQRLRFDQ
jgi:S-formylglutathione hydrolase FrmB